MLTAALFIIAGTWDQLTCPSTGEWANRGRQTHVIWVVTQPRPGVKGRYTRSVEVLELSEWSKTGGPLTERTRCSGTGRHSVGRCMRELSEMRGMLYISGVSHAGGHHCQNSGRSTMEICTSVCVHYVSKEKAACLKRHGLQLRPPREPGKWAQLGCWTRPPILEASQLCLERNQCLWLRR